MDLPIDTGRLTLMAMGPATPVTDEEGRLTAALLTPRRPPGYATTPSDVPPTLPRPVVELHAQVHARRFYERAGFTPFGEVYLEAGIEHIGMRRELQGAGQPTSSSL